jgi:hypothetical protein
LPLPNYKPEWSLFMVGWYYSIFRTVAAQQIIKNDLSINSF